MSLPEVSAMSDDDYLEVSTENIPLPLIQEY